MKRKETRAAARQQEKTALDIARRIAAAEREFAALLNRYAVTFDVERVQSALQGAYTRIVFYPRAREAPAPTPPKETPYP